MFVFEVIDVMLLVFVLFLALIISVGTLAMIIDGCSWIIDKIIRVIERKKRD